MKGTLGKLHQKSHFRTYLESERLEKKIQALIKVGKVKEIAVYKPEHPLLEEHWYRDVETGEIYRYCPPEFPARRNLSTTFGHSL